MMPTDLPRHWTAFAEGGVHLVTVPVDYSENTRVLVDELPARAIEKRTRP
jgi:acetolactate synthase I/II/III large subunit